MPRMNRCNWVTCWPSEQNPQVNLLLRPSICHAADELASDDVTRALAVAVGTLLVQEQLKQSTVMGLVAEAMVSHDQQVTAPTCCIRSVHASFAASGCDCINRC